MASRILQPFTPMRDLTNISNSDIMKHVKELYPSPPTTNGNQSYSKNPINKRRTITPLESKQHTASALSMAMRMSQQQEKLQLNIPESTYLPPKGKKIIKKTSKKRLQQLSKPKLINSRLKHVSFSPERVVDHERVKKNCRKAAPFIWISWPVPISAYETLEVWSLLIRCRNKSSWLWQEREMLSKPSPNLLPSSASPTDSFLFSGVHCITFFFLRSDFFFLFLSFSFLYLLTSFYP